MRRGLLAGVVAAVAVAGPAHAQSLSANGLTLTQIGSFSSPVFATSPPGDPSRIMVVEQTGTIALVKNGAVAPQKFLDIHTAVHGGGEQGLLSMAFAPDYATSGRFYVYYTDAAACSRTTGGCDNRLDEFTVSDSDHANPASDRKLLTFPHQTHSNHNGGQLQSGPDGMLYVSTGDGGGGNDQDCNAQRLSPAGEGRALLGKLIRIDPHPGSGGAAYTIPPDNPFVGSDKRPELWAYGLRNPWRFSFDAMTGDLVVGDVGQGAHEEIDFTSRGTAPPVNYGWSFFEGNAPFSNGCSYPAPPNPHTPPVFAYDHVGGNCSITGGYVVRNTALGSLLGRYLYGDYCVSQLRSIAVGPGTSSGDADTGLSVGTNNLSSFGQDAQCRVYVTSLSGPVYRLDPSGSPGAGACQSAAPPPDTTAPVLSAVSLLRKRFTARRGTAFRFTVSETSMVRIGIARLRRGRYRTLGVIVRHGLGPGRHVVHLSRKLNGRALATGRYRATLVASDAARNVSAAVLRGFTVVSVRRPR